MAYALPYESSEGEMACPYLKEIVMLYCDGFPVKKMVPLDRIVSASPCLTHDFNGCPLYREVLARVQGCAQTASVGPEAPPPCLCMKEARR